MGPQKHPQPRTVSSFAGARHLGAILAYAMNYYDARQRKSDNRWDYTCMNGDRVWPVGYCGDHKDGHETAVGAQECYKQYLLDRHLKLDQRMPGQQRRCQVKGCDAWTQKYASIGVLRMFILCDTHRTLEVVSSRFSVGSSTSSY